MVYNSIIEALSKLGGIKDWKYIHVEVGLVSGKKHEILFANPDEVVVAEKPVVSEPKKPVVVETLREKINRMRLSQVGELPEVEETWYKERQKELELHKIGQILPEESLDIAMEKLAKIGLKE